MSRPISVNTVIVFDDFTAAQIKQIVNITWASFFS